VFHDADAPGYNIARTLREETARMPGFSLDVIDLGLGFEEAIGLGFEPEEFTRKKALPKGLVLNEVERRAFEGRQVGPKSWICQRIEVNQLGAARMAAHIEQRLLACGVRGKVVPPVDRLQLQFRSAVKACVEAQVQAQYEKRIAKEAKKRLEEMAAVIKEKEIDLESVVRSNLERDRTRRWVDVLSVYASQVFSEATRRQKGTEKES
jgi:hypothetical protein